MQPTHGFLYHALRLASQMKAGILSRDGLNLGPLVLTQAAARRFRVGLRALEAFLRRVLLLFALQLEPGLQPRATLWKSRSRKAARGQLSKAPTPGFRLLKDERAVPEWLAISGASSSASQSGPWLTYPLYSRLAMLSDLIANPHARARRLAFHLARRRPGPLLAPGFALTTTTRRFGTEISMQFDAMAEAIHAAGRARPPPLGPLPGPGPRIRRL